MSVSYTHLSLTRSSGETTLPFDEPFKKLFNQGMITGKNGIKMSKSKGNVVSPDDLVRDYGCDSLRLYELFVGPPELDAEWDDRGIAGVSDVYKRQLLDIVKILHRYEIHNFLVSIISQKALFCNFQRQFQNTIFKLGFKMSLR